MIEFIHIADVHLGARPDKEKSWSEKREAEIWESFYRLLELIQEQRIPLLLIAGDLFHRQPLLREVKEIQSRFARLTETQIVLIAGNHDYLRIDSNFRKVNWTENVHFFQGQVLEYITFPQWRVRIYGYSYLEREILGNPYQATTALDNSYVNILLAHGGDAKHVPFQNAYFANSPFDYIALGHIHKPAIIRKNRAAYPGSLEPLDYTEMGAHGFIKGYLHEKREQRVDYVEIQQVAFAKRRYHTILVEVTPTMEIAEVEDLILEQVGHYGNQHFYQVLLRGQKRADIEFQFSYLKKKMHLIGWRDETVPKYDFLRLKKLYQNTILERYIESFEQEELDDCKQYALYEGVQALLETKK